MPHYYAKFAWALRFTEWGYVTVFIEADQYFFADPLPHYNSFNDLEGLSDWREVVVPGPKVSRSARQCLPEQRVCDLSQSCQQYQTVRPGAGSVQAPLRVRTPCLLLCPTLCISQCSHVDLTLLQGL